MLGLLELRLKLLEFPIDLRNVNYFQAKTFANIAADPGRRLEQILPRGSPTLDGLQQGGLQGQGAQYPAKARRHGPNESRRRRWRVKLDHHSYPRDDNEGLDVRRSHWSLRHGLPNEVGTQTHHIGGLGAWGLAASTLLGYK